MNNMQLHEQKFELRVLRVRPATTIRQQVSSAPELYFLCSIRGSCAFTNCLVVGSRCANLGSPNFEVVSSLSGGKEGLLLPGSLSFAGYGTGANEDTILDISV